MAAEIYAVAEEVKKNQVLEMFQRAESLVEGAGIYQGAGAPAASPRSWMASIRGPAIVGGVQQNLALPAARGADQGTEVQADAGAA